MAYAVYFTQVVAGGGEQGTFLWSIAITSSMLVIGIASPLLGAIADYSANKKSWVLGFTVLCVAATASLYFVGPGDVAAGMVIFILANMGFVGALGVYYSFLSELSDEKNVGRLSGYGFALGYLGGTIALGICLPLLSGGLEAENLPRFRASFLVTAAFYAVFSIPFFLWLRERARPRGAGGAGEAFRGGYQRLALTFRRVRTLSELFRFLLAYLIYNDGVETAIYFSAIYAVQEMGFTVGETVILFLVVQLSALVGSLVFGFLSDRIGAKPSIVATLILWCAVVIWAYAATSKQQFWMVSLVAGLGLGSNQACSRGLMRMFVPAGRDAEFYGFFSICGKFSAFLGPLVYGAVARMAGSHRTAILSVLFFFAAGLILLVRVNVARGRQAALDYAEP